MSFNHYAKLKRILASQPEGWHIKRINEPTTTKNFRGEKIHYEYYYRIYDAAGQPVKYGKFQQIERLAQALDIPAESLPVIDDE